VQGSGSSAIFMALVQGNVEEQQMHFRFAIAAFVLGAVLTGCGGEGHHDQRTLAPPTGRFELTVAADEPSSAALVRAAGSFDENRHRFSLVTELAGPIAGIDGHLAIIATTDSIYVNCPYLARLLGATTTWISVRGDAGAILRSTILDPLHVIDAVLHRDRLVGRTTMRFADGPEGGGAVVSVEYFDVGAPVVIDPPAADQVTDETETFNRLYGGTTGG
jgi:hypothetical protein